MLLLPQTEKKILKILFIRYKWHQSATKMLSTHIHSLLEKYLKKRGDFFRLIWKKLQFSNTFSF